VWKRELSQLRGQDTFAGKYMYEKLTKCANFTSYLPQKYSPPPIFFWGGGISYTYDCRDVHKWKDQSQNLSVAASHAWKRFPTELKLQYSTSTFRRKLKGSLISDVHGV